MLCIEKKDRYRLALVIYITIIYTITVIRPTHPSAGFMHGTINLSLFTEYVPIVQEGRWLAFIWLFVGNIIWFVPLGVFLRIFNSWKNRKYGVGMFISAGAGMCVSLSIEVLQFVFGKGVSEIDDLILNTLGVIIGYWAIERIRNVWIRHYEAKHGIYYLTGEEKQILEMYHRFSPEGKADMDKLLSDCVAGTDGSLGVMDNFDDRLADIIEAEKSRIGNEMTRGEE